MGASPTESPGSVCAALRGLPFPGGGGQRVYGMETCRSCGYPPALASQAPDRTAPWVQIAPLLSAARVRAWALPTHPPLDFTPGNQGDMCCTHFPHEDMAAEIGCLFPQATQPARAEPGFEPEPPSDPGTGAPRCPQSPRWSLQELFPLPTARGEVPAGPGLAREVLGQPSWALGKQRARAAVCGVTARLILPTAAGGRGTVCFPWESMFEVLTIFKTGPRA